MSKLANIKITSDSPSSNDVRIFLDDRDITHYVKHVEYALDANEPNTVLMTLIPGVMVVDLMVDKKNIDIVETD